MCLIIRHMANDEAHDETVICTYRVRADQDARFTELLAQHWRLLRELELVMDSESLLFRSLDEGAPTYVEIFTWVAGGFARAHEHPDVLTIWEAMDPLLEERNGQPRWQFPHFERVSLDR
jgi:hypothetical protein